MLTIHTGIEIDNSLFVENLVREQLFLQPFFDSFRGLESYRLEMIEGIERDSVAKVGLNKANYVDIAPSGLLQPDAARPRPRLDGAQRVIGASGQQIGDALSDVLIGQRRVDGRTQTDVIELLQ